MEWVRALSSDELPEGAKEVVRAGQWEVLLIRHKGQVYAVDSVCPHMGRSLRDGEVTEEGLIICPLHRSAFRLSTGEVMAWAPWPPGVGRALGAIKKRRPLRVFPVKVEENCIWVGLE